MSYSATVDIYLERDGQRIPVSQVCNGTLYLPENISVSTGFATLVIVVEGERWAKRIEIFYSFGWEAGYREVSP